MCSFHFIHECCNFYLSFVEYHSYDNAKCKWQKTYQAQCEQPDTIPVHCIPPW